MKVIAVLLVALAGFIESLSGQIVDGAPGQNVVSLSFQTSKGQHLCGGNLIDYHVLLTAAHCTDQHFYSTQYVAITVGTNYFQNSNVTRIVPASSFIIHPLYNPRTLANNIALIHVQDLSQELGLDYVPLAISNYTRVGQFGQVFWRSGIVGQIMQIENVTVIEYESNITDTTICTTPVTGCYLPGSPLTVNGELTGLASYKFKGEEEDTCIPKEKFFFINLSAYMDFFNQTIKLLKSISFSPSL